MVLSLPIHSQFFDKNRSRECALQGYPETKSEMKGLPPPVESTSRFRLQTEVEAKSMYMTRLHVGESTVHPEICENKRSVWEKKQRLGRKPLTEDDQKKLRN